MFNETNDENPKFIEHRRALSDIVRLSAQYQAAPDKKKCALLEEWGTCIAIALHLEMELQGPSTLYGLEHVEPPTLAENVLTSISQFFDAVQTQLQVLPWPRTRQGVPKHPGLRGLVTILDVADNNIAGSPTLNRVLTSGIWNPERLLDVLQSTQQLQQDSDFKATRRWQNIPFWRFTQMLAIATITSEWVPPLDYGPKMWYVPVFHQFPAPEEAFAIFVEKVPHSFSASLEYYLSETAENISVGMIEQMFAMDWSKTNPEMAVQMLLALVYAHNLDNTYEDGMRCFQQHNPDLFAAFQIQASLFNDSGDAKEYAQACLPVWNNAIHGAAIEDLPLPELGLERP